MSNAEHACNPPLVAVLADDLTGAADTGMQFAGAGLRTAVFLAAPPAATGTLDMAVIDTATRGVPPDVAAAITAAACQQLRSAGATLIFKKVDSTLRGNLGAELDAILAQGDLVGVVLCPAFPAQGRTLVDGLLLVDGRPVAETAAGRDPVAPVRVSHLPTLLAQQTQRPIAHLPLAVVGAGSDTLLPALEAALPAGGVAVCDAVTDEHLAAIVAAVDRMAARPLLVGSAGLAQPLAVQVAAARRVPALVICGSLHPVARRQATVLAATAWCIELDVEAAQAGGTAWAQWLAEMQAQLRAGRQAEQDVLLTTPADLAPGCAAMLPAWLAEAASAVLATVRVAGVAVTGGDTLRGLLAAWQATGIDLAGALAPGIPIGRIRGGQQAGLPIITKAGGFGTPKVLAEAAHRLTHRESELP